MSNEIKEKPGRKSYGKYSNIKVSLSREGELYLTDGEDKKPTSPQVREAIDKLVTSKEKKLKVLYIKDLESCFKGGDKVTRYFVGDYFDKGEKCSEIVMIDNEFHISKTNENIQNIIEQIKKYNYDPKKMKLSLSSLSRDQFDKINELELKKYNKKSIGEMAANLEDNYDSYLREKLEENSKRRELNESLKENVETQINNSDYNDKIKLNNKNGVELAIKTNDLGRNIINDYNAIITSLKKAYEILKTNKKLQEKIFNVQGDLVKLLDIDNFPEDFFKKDDYYYSVHRPLNTFYAFNASRYFNTPNELKDLLSTEWDDCEYIKSCKDNSLPFNSFLRYPVKLSKYLLNEIYEVNSNYKNILSEEDIEILKVLELNKLAFDKKYSDFNSTKSLYTKTLKQNEHFEEKLREELMLEQNPQEKINKISEEYGFENKYSNLIKEKEECIESLTGILKETFVLKSSEYKYEVL